ncbi:MAG: hypothetical protein ACYSUI_17290 [Planctomycetota bacterium]|jgi:hypothetical protein
MRALLLSTIVLVVLPVAGLYAQPALTEPPEFPSGIPGPSATHSGEGCFHLAAGAIVPGDVDWVQIVIPVASTQTIVDVDFPDGEGSSALLASVVDGSTGFNIDDGNSAIDDLCGLGSSSDPLGSPQDSVVDLGATALGDVINIGVTGAEDTNFTGQHDRNFSYDVWVYIVAVPCTNDPECDDGLYCTGVETCVDGACQSSGDPCTPLGLVCDETTDTCKCDDNADCDDGLFCNGAETCVAGDCEDGVDPCPGQECDEDNDECVPDAGVARLDIKPGACPNRLNSRSRGVLSVALVGAGDFDVAAVDASSILLARVDGIGGQATPMEGPPGPRTRLDDLATPFEGEPCDCHQAEGDGVDDLSMKFSVPELVTVLELDELPTATAVELIAMGNLSDGSNFEAVDCVIVRQPRGRPRARDAASTEDDMQAAGTRSEAAESPPADEADSGQEAADAQNPSTVGCGALSPAILLMTGVAVSLVAPRRRPSRASA